MKKVFFIVCSLFVFAAVTNAQEAKPTETKAPTKEERQKMKEKQEADMAAAFKEIGLTDEQVNQVKAAMDEASEKNKTIKADNTLTDDQKKEKMKEVTDAKNAKIKAVMGEEKYRQYNAIRKKQKDAQATPGGN
jgi:Spy/CpxP family protein refolding chaperone